MTRLPARWRPRPAQEGGRSDSYVVFAVAAYDPRRASW